MQKPKTECLDQRDNERLNSKWNKFKQNMECDLFHTTALLDETYQLCALIDPGSTAFATISQKFVDKFRFHTQPLKPRLLTGVLDNISGVINQVASFSLDVGGLLIRNTWAYVVSGQTEDLILGMPWLKHCHAELDPVKCKLNFKLHNLALVSDEARERNQIKLGPAAFKVNQIMASTFAGLAQRAKKKPGIEIFAASMSDIEKALRPKVQLSIEEITQMLPETYKPYADAFHSKEAATLPPHRPGIDHEIPLEKDESGKEKQVPWGPLYNMSHDELLVLRKELTSLLDKDFIRQSKSSAAAPVLFAKKPGGGLRFCVDYRGINAITRKDRYPLPLIKETLNALNAARWLTKLDVSAAFHKIRMAKGEEWKTAFRTRYGLFEWKVCPFGLTGSPATFQRYINWVLREYLDDFCSAYVDDILIFSTGSLQDHREKVCKVLNSLREHGLHLDLAKCEFETKCTKYLGYIIEVGVGIRMDPAKVQAISEWKSPTNVKSVRSFLGFANYYRLFIKDFAILAQPLTNLTRKNQKFVWDEACEAAFQHLKQLFKEEPVLATYDPDLETRLEPDSSGWAVGGVLSQKDPVTHLWRPVAYYSAKHLPAECNYDIHDKELLAIIKCIKEWNGELRGLKKRFTILTDHKNLEPFKEKKSLNERQVRWSEILSSLNFKLEHRPGKASIIPDALSRREQDVPKNKADLRVMNRERILLPEKLWVNQLSSSDLQCPFAEDGNLHKLWEEALTSKETAPSYLRAYEAVMNRERQFPPELSLRMATGECSIEKNILHYRERIWLPNHEPLTTAVIQKTHDSFLSGHPGRDATISLVGRKFFWPGYNQDIRRFVKNCDVCGRTTVWRDKKKGLLKPLPIPNQIWQEISMDFITGLPPSGPQHITTLLVITDRLSKGLILIPVPPDHLDAKGLAAIFIQYYIPHHWIPRAIVSDRGPQFVNAFWSTICQLLNINQRLSTAYHPETDGSTERANQEIETFLRTFVTYEQDDWVRWIPLAQVSINNKPSVSTKISPFFLTHGYDANPLKTIEVENPSLNTPAFDGRMVVDKLKEAQDFAVTAMAIAQQSQEMYANMHRESSVSYMVGDKVWLNLRNIATERPSKKLDWIHAKYTVTKTFPNNAHFYELDTPKGIHNKFHTSLLRPASNNPLPSQENDDSQPPGIVMDDGDIEFGIDKILKSRMRKVGRGKRKELLVKWTGYAKPSWHPEIDFLETTAYDTFLNNENNQGG